MLLVTLIIIKYYMLTTSYNSNKWLELEKSVIPYNFFTINIHDVINIYI